MNPSLKNILRLVRIVLVIPVQTASLERGFSLKKRIKMIGDLSCFRQQSLNLSISPFTTGFLKDTCRASGTECMNGGMVHP